MCQGKNMGKYECQGKIWVNMNVSRENMGKYECQGKIWVNMNVSRENMGKYECVKGKYG